MKLGVCKLCGGTRRLCRKSHIIPEFMYGELFDEKHSLIKFDVEGNFKHPQRTGEYDENILCQRCDNEVLGRLETYAADVFYDNKIDKVRIGNFRNQHGVEFTYCDGIDYTKFKLFLLSILWRASISKRSTFSQVKLGPYEGAIRQMILNNNPGTQLDYPCFISTYRKHENLPNELIVSPKKLKRNGGTGYSFLISGLLYVFYISKSSIPQAALSEIAISESNKMKIVHMPEYKAKEFLAKYLG